MAIYLVIFVHGSLTTIPINASRKEVAGRLFQLKAKPMAASDTALAFGVAEKNCLKFTGLLRR